MSRRVLLPFFAAGALLLAPVVHAVPAAWGGFYGIAFTPTTNTYTSGSSVETAPVGASQVVITADGSGGSGGRDNLNSGGGGGGSGRTVKTCAISGGQTMSYSVGATVFGVASNNPGNNGNSSTVTGTIACGSISLTAGGGGAGGGPVQSDAGGTAGTASGGDTNTNGHAGNTGVSGTTAGGAAASGAAGGHTGSVAGTAPGGGGAGVATGTSGGSGSGQISFSYTWQTRQVLRGYGEGLA